MPIHDVPASPNKGTCRLALLLLGVAILLAAPGCVRFGFNRRDAEMAASDRSLEHQPSSERALSDLRQVSERGTPDAPADRGPDRGPDRSLDRGPDRSPDRALREAAVGKSVRIVFDTTSTGASVAVPVASFPLLVRLSQPEIFAATQPDGKDIRFLDADGKTWLNYEIESWNQAAKQGVVWVRVPQIDGNSNTDFITLYYGVTPIPGTESSVAVFPPAEGNIAVYHFGSPSSLANSASAKHALTNQASVLATSNIGSGYNLTGTSYLSAADDLELEPPSFTVSCWFNPTIVLSGYNKIVTKGRVSGPFASYSLEHRYAAGVVGFQTARVDGKYRSLDSTPVLKQGVWSHLVGTFDSATGASRFYVNGVEVGTDSYAAAIDYYTSETHDLMIGVSEDALPGAPFANGIIDEVRIESAARSAAWVKLCYESQRAGQKLISFQP